MPHHDKPPSSQSVMSTLKLLAIPCDILVLTIALAVPLRAETPAEFDRRLDALPVVDEIDPSVQPPAYQYPNDASRVGTLLGRPARVLPPGDGPKVMAWVIGRGRGLKPGAAYLLEVDYPDDLPRTLFIANRGADLVRGFATGSATGDCRQQYVQPSLESLDYPQTGQWQRHRMIFFLHDRFQGLYAQRDSRPGGRPFGPADGFHVIIFQSKRLNDPRSQGAAIGRIRLRAVPDHRGPLSRGRIPSGRPAPPPRVLAGGDGRRSRAGRDVNDRGVTDPLDWLLFKARMARLLAINTFAKDLLEFGFNQGWQSGDPNWVNNAQPPITDLWDRAVPRIAAEGLDLLPYYEYKGAIGLKEARPLSLGWQRRAEKLYHNLPNTRYTPIWWTEDHNADLTDPDTLADARRLLDRTVIAHKGKAQFRRRLVPRAGQSSAGQLCRGHCRPVSRGPCRRFTRSIGVAADTHRFLRGRSPALRSLHRLVAARAARFFERLGQHLAEGLGDSGVRILFTPWTSEQIPMLRDPASGKNGHPVQIVTDEPAVVGVASPIAARHKLVPMGTGAHGIRQGRT